MDLSSLFGDIYQKGSYGNILTGLFGNAGAPYQSASNTLNKYMPQAMAYQQPFYNAGTEAIGNYQDWLSGMQDPSKFINDLMGQYQESPWAQYQQQQSMRAAENMGSASGLTGSTPLQLQAQQNAANISSQDMNQWLQNVLGINTQYGHGNQFLMGQGANSANSLSNMMSQMGAAQAALKFGGQLAKQKQQGSLISGITGIFGL